MKNKYGVDVIQQIYRLTVTYITNMVNTQFTNFTHLTADRRSFVTCANVKASRFEVFFSLHTP